MIVLLKEAYTDEELLQFQTCLAELGLASQSFSHFGGLGLGLSGEITDLIFEQVSLHPIVKQVFRTNKPSMQVERLYHEADTVFALGGSKIGGKELVLMAGPCAVEDRQGLWRIGQGLKEAGCHVIRGGAYKPRTSPYSFQGLGDEGIELLAELSKDLGLPFVSEITSLEQLGLFAEKVDIIQVGARNMQNFELLKELGRLDKPVLLKRGFVNTVEELLGSAEYIMLGGNSRIILCERGIRSFDTTTRACLDLGSVAYLKQRSHLPVIVDPSHAAGRADLVAPLALAGIAAGADGLQIEVHDRPSLALSDGAQALSLEMYQDLSQKLADLAKVLGRSLVFV